VANYRQVHTKIWKDSWFLQLSPDDKLLFIYLFSNEQASIAGIYELPVMVIAFETGLGIDYVTDALQRFEEAGKVRYQDGIVWVVNLRKYNENPSPKVRTRIRNDIALIPDSKIKTDYIQYHKGIDTVSIPKLENESEHEHEHEQEHEQESSPPTAEIAAPPSPKPPPPKPPSETILPDTPEARVMFAKLAANAKQKGRRAPKQFGSLEMKRKFINAVARLDGRFEYALDAGLGNGITAVGKLVNWLASPKWQEKQKRGGDGTRQRNSRTRTGETTTPLPPRYDPEEVERNRQLLAEHQARMREVSGDGSTTA
jgi:hypothetical protein